MRYVRAGSGAGGWGKDDDCVCLFVCLFVCLLLSVDFLGCWTRLLGLVA